jgi:CRP-like cAMP-binding protein
VAQGREEQTVRAALRRAFPSLSAPEITDFSGIWEPVSLGAGQSIWLVEKETLRMVLCASGRLSHLRVPDGKARPRCLRVLSCGSIVGLPLLVHEAHACYPEKVDALVPSLLLVAAPETVFSFCARQPAAYRDLVGALARELAVQQLRFERQKSQSLIANLALSVLVFSNRFGDSQDPHLIPPDLSARRFLAALMGCSEESVHRAISDLRAEGLIDTAHARLRVLNRARLVQRANIDPALWHLLVRASAQSREPED